jgi:hypothetical protein
LGGLYVRVFAIKFPNEVPGLVLIDPLHERQGIEWNRIDPEGSARSSAAFGKKFSPAGKAELAAIVQGVGKSGTLGTSATLPDVPTIVITSCRGGLTIPYNAIRRALHAELFQPMTNGMHIVTARASPSSSHRRSRPRFECNCVGAGYGEEAECRMSPGIH